MIKWRAATLEEFIMESYWENPADAIGDIRKFIRHNQMIFDTCYLPLEEHDDGERPELVRQHPAKE